MKDRYEYIEGRCNICHEDKEVRWKNIYLNGSEGTNMCIECERELLSFLRERSLFYAMAKKEVYKNKKR